MKETTLCYIERDGKYLMLYRNKKENDQSAGKWLGIGGKLEKGEDKDACLLREVKEETGLTLKSFEYRARIEFISDIWDDEIMHLYTAKEFDGDITDCNEGDLAWIEKEKVMDLPLWEGDREFLRLLSEDAGYFDMRLVYKGDDLIETWYEIR